MKLVHWPLMGALLHLVQQGGDWAGHSRRSPLLAVPNITYFYLATGRNFRGGKVTTCCRI